MEKSVLSVNKRTSFPKGDKLWILKGKEPYMLGMVVNTFNICTWEAGGAL